VLGRRKESEPVDSAMFANPISRLHVIGMGIFGEAPGLRLLRRKEPLPPFSDSEKLPLGVTVIPWHDTNYN